MKKVLILLVLLIPSLIFAEYTMVKNTKAKNADLKWNHTLLENRDGHVIIQFTRKKTNEDVVVPFLYIGAIHPDNRKIILDEYAEKLEAKYQEIKTEEFMMKLDYVLP